MNINIFLIESPMQLLSAIEASSYHENEENVLIIKFSNKNRVENNQQISRLLKLSSWDEIIYLNVTQKISFFSHLSRRFFLNRIHKKFKRKVSTLYIGDFRSEWMHSVRSVTCPKVIFLLDDGAVTVNVQDGYLSKGVNAPEFNVNGFFRKLIKNIIYFRINSEFNSNTPINLFTSFDIKALNDQRVIKHNYERLRNLVVKERSSKDNEVLFFGSKYSEAGIVNFDSEVKMLNDIKKYFRREFVESEITYIAHRDDSNHKLDYIKSNININVIRLKFPAEVYLLQRKVHPKCISGFYTSVLPNLKRLIPTIPVISFRIPIEVLNVRNREAVSRIYSFYESVGVDVIDIPIEDDSS